MWKASIFRTTTPRTRRSRLIECGSVRDRRVSRSARGSTATRISTGASGPQRRGQGDRHSRSRSSPKTTGRCKRSTHLGLDRVIGGRNAVSCRPRGGPAHCRDRQDRPGVPTGLSRRQRAERAARREHRHSVQLAQGLQAAASRCQPMQFNYPYGAGQILTLAPNNGKPTQATPERQVKLKDGVTPESRSALGSAHDSATSTVMERCTSITYYRKIDPDLSFVWLRNPDSTEHQFGPGSLNYLDALRAQDRAAREVAQQVDRARPRPSARICWSCPITATATVAGGTTAISAARAQRRAGRAWRNRRQPAADGYPLVSGEIRSADVLTRAGLAHVYDGGGCSFDRCCSGSARTARSSTRRRHEDAGACAPKPAPKLAGQSKAVAAKLFDAAVSRAESGTKDAIVIAPNGGSEYFYVLRSRSGQRFGHWCSHCRNTARSAHLRA